MRLSVLRRSDFRSDTLIALGGTMQPPSGRRCRGVQNRKRSAFREVRGL